MSTVLFSGVFRRYDWKYCFFFWGYIIETLDRNSKKKFQKVKNLKVSSSIKFQGAFESFPKYHILQKYQNITS